jgi:hypothetical protein
MKEDQRMRRSLTNLFAWCLALTLCVQTGSDASAAVMPVRSLDDLASAAGVICICQVRALHSQWDPDQEMIVTIVTLEVEEYIKGAGETTLQIQIPGGIVGDQGLKVTGAPVFQEQERSVVFLKSGRSDRMGDHWHHVVGWAQGKFTIHIDPGSGEELIRRNLAGVHFTPPRGATEAPMPRTLKQLRTAIASIVGTN